MFFLAHSQSCTTITTINFRTDFDHPKKKCHAYQHSFSFLLPTPSPWQPLIYFLYRVGWHVLNKMPMLSVLPPSTEPDLVLSFLPAVFFSSNFTNCFPFSSFGSQLTIEIPLLSLWATLHHSTYHRCNLTFIHMVFD